ncbi:uncharacterized protein LOC134659176 [Cydia amplana]|uniref:uncharacterized protein LOC134659176 n=1 Tax=Cydia amplana TaxID=1869771 RepID=UPI002FE58D38
MSTPGRGRGYSGRHHLRSPRPGDDDSRALAELSPRATDKPEPKQEKEKEDVADKERKREEVKYHVSGEDETALKELLQIEEPYTPLLTLLEQFSPGEDGIAFNRKLKHFETTVSSLCPDEAHLQQAFGTFRAAALLSAVTSRKLAAVGASFTRQSRQQLLRGALLNVVMQGTFSKLDVLERANPLFLINAANLMGDYFAEARLCNGNKVHILAGPLLQYMKALLASDDIRAHRSLATQLMQNGRELLSVLSQELDELSISIRLRLLAPPASSIIWLLLSADLCLNKFLPLPNTLQQFYAAHLDLASEDNYSEVSYGSWKKSPEKDDYNRADVSSDLSDKVSQNISQISLDGDGEMKPKLRPILGAGAGLLRQEQALSVSQDNFETWTSKNSLSKRYDLNSWRQEEEKKEEEPVFNPTVLPPNLQNYPVTVPDYPPPNVPNVNRFNNYMQENYPNYLQQGDGAYIQNSYTGNTNFNSQGDGFVQQFPNDRPAPERVNSEIQKASAKRPVENWRKDKDAEDPNRNRPRNWTRQRSKDNLSDEKDPEKEERYRSNSRSSRDKVPGRFRRNSTDNPDGAVSGTGKTPPRRHVSDVPRSQKYWDHDDRCDKDYSS